MASMSSTATITLSKEELRQIDEYGKIVNFRERVLSGKHPNIKVPAHLLAAKTSNASPPTSSSTSALSDGPTTNAISSFHVKPSSSRKTLDVGAAENRQAFQANSLQPSLMTSFPGLGSLPGDPGGSSTPTSAKTFGSARAEINPIFLEKSDHLIKTELQLQRQRVERALREQLEQRRNTSWSLQPSEPLPDFDLMDVLQQALVLAQQKASSHADGNVATNNSDDAESLQGNTYASTYIDDSPNSNHLDRLPDRPDPEDVEMRESSDYEPELSFMSEPAVPIDNKGSMPTNIASSANHRPNAPGSQQTQNALVAAQRPPSPRIQDAAVHIVSSGESADASGSADSGHTDNEQSADDRTKSIASNRLAQAYGAGISTVVRAHDLSPVAPQPSHVSSLAITRGPQSSDTRRARATPAQVVAIRNEVSAVSSPESSPQTSKANEKRKGKKKNKRKADRQAADATPYIKAEPRSPSPFSAHPAGRPHKRLRPSQRSMEQLNYDESRSPQVRREIYRDQHGALSYGEENPRVGYERRDVSLREGPAPVHTSAQPYDHDIYEIRRPVSTQFSQDQDPTAYPIQYTNEPRVRTASQAVVDRASLREAPVYYDLRDEPHMSVRPANDRDRSPSPTMRESRPAAMAPPPRIQPTRIIVDEYGREYIEPPRPPSVARHSVAATAAAEPLVYDHHVPGRAFSRMADTYGDGVIYRRPLSPPFAAPRRVITEPEYVAGEYRSYRQREYSVVPQGSTAGDDYVRGRAPPERRVIENLPREYITRAASVRPTETVRYEMAGGYGERYASIRPDVPVREYASSVHPESRREVVYQQPYSREFSVRPEAGAQRAYSVRPPESQQFQYDRPVRAEADAPYLDRSRGAPEGVIYEDTLRGSYR
ncbi:hypothetical protein MCOR12_011047 [Pyricularia oryzae]|nr:hypothetical protein MCOR12_011047 [Pyricularia oryzae]